jgi:glutamate--cysteine ligase
VPRLRNVDTLLRQIRAKYREYGIEQTPFVIVKADAGTYGMGIMTVRDAAEVRRPQPPHSATRCRWSRKAMQVSEVILQEGVPTVRDACPTAWPSRWST